MKIRTSLCTYHTLWGMLSELLTRQDCAVYLFLLPHAVLIVSAIACAIPIKTKEDVGEDTWKILRAIIYYYHMSHSELSLPAAASKLAHHFAGSIWLIMVGNWVDSQHDPVGLLACSSDSCFNVCAHALALHAVEPRGRPKSQTGAKLSSATPLMPRYLPDLVQWLSRNRIRVVRTNPLKLIKTCLLMAKEQPSIDPVTQMKAGGTGNWHSTAGTLN